MILEFKHTDKSDGALLREYARKSETWTAREFKAYWAEQEANNTRIWQAFGPEIVA